MTAAKFRTVIVGLGGLSKSMIPTMQSFPWFEPVGLVDVRQEALSRFGDQLGLGPEALFTGLDRALAELKPDLTLINTPPRFHYEQTKQALLAGSNALVAKPLAVRFEDALDLVRLADRLGLKLTVGQQMRFHRHYQAVKRFLRSDRLGTVEFINFTNAKHRPNMAECTMDQPCLYEMSCHHFDCLLDAVPDYVPDRVLCDGFQPTWSPYNGPCMVNASIVFRHEVHPPLHVYYHAGFSSQSHNYEYRLEGSKGVIRCRGFHMSNDTMAYEFAERGRKLAPIEADEGIPVVVPFEAFFDVWLDYMNGGPEPSFSGRNNLKVFAMLCACEEAIRTGMPVRIADHPLLSQAFRLSAQSGGGR